MTSGFLRWKSHVDKLLRFNHMTMTLGVEPFRVVESGAQILHQRLHENRHEQHLARSHANTTTTTIQYAFDSTSNFPSPFLTDSPRFHSSFEPSLRHLPCILFLHGCDPGGFDVARWMAGGMSRAHQLCNPLMPSRFGSYSVYNVQEVSNSHGAIPKHDHTTYTSTTFMRNRPAHMDEQSQPPFATMTSPFSLLSISRPGYLESSSLHTSSFPAQATAVSRLVGSLRIPSLHIVAHTVSAPIALEMAGLPGFRKRVRSICLVDPQLAPHSRIQDLSKRFQSLGPEWARTRAAYNALARSANDSYFRQAVSEICGSESLVEIDDDPAMAQLYEGIGVFFTHWSMRKHGMLSDNLALKRLDRNLWNSVESPIICLMGVSQPFDSVSRSLEMEDHIAAAEESARAALVNVKSNLEFVRIYGSGKLLFPLGRVSKTCLDFIYKHH